MEMGAKRHTTTEHDSKQDHSQSQQEEGAAVVDQQGQEQGQEERVEREEERKSGERKEREQGKGQEGRKEEEEEEEGQKEGQKNKEGRDNTNNHLLSHKDSQGGQGQGSLSKTDNSHTNSQRNDSKDIHGSDDLNEPEADEEECMSDSRESFPKGAAASKSQPKPQKEQERRGSDYLKFKQTTNHSQADNGISSSRRSSSASQASRPRSHPQSREDANGNGATVWDQIKSSVKELIHAATEGFRNYRDNNSDQDQGTVTILGRTYSGLNDAEFLDDFRSRLWITYRYNYPPIKPSHYTSDVGWGCMLRSGQMLLANAFVFHYLGRGKFFSLSALIVLLKKTIIEWRRSQNAFKSNWEKYIKVMITQRRNFSN
jgi:hypothetical protein